MRIRDLVEAAGPKDIFREFRDKFLTGRETFDEDRMQYYAPLIMSHINKKLAEYFPSDKFDIQVHEKTRPSYAQFSCNVTYINGMNINYMLIIRITDEALVIDSFNFGMEDFHYKLSFYKKTTNVSEQVYKCFAKFAQKVSNRVL